MLMTSDNKVCFSTHFCLSAVLYIKVCGWRGGGREVSHIMSAIVLFTQDLYDIGFNYFITFFDFWCTVKMGHFLLSISIFPEKGEILFQLLNWHCLLRLDFSSKKCYKFYLLSTVYSHLRLNVPGLETGLDLELIFQI